jgi:hypothetical protein
MTRINQSLRLGAFLFVALLALAWHPAHAADICQNDELFGHQYGLMSYCMTNPPNATDGRVGNLPVKIYAVRGEAGKVKYLATSCDGRNFKYVLVKYNGADFWDVISRGSPVGAVDFAVCHHGAEPRAF